MTMMQKGQYYVGDLCYVLHAEWDEVCSLIINNKTNSCDEGIFTLADGRKFAIFNTAYGDGQYRDNQGNDGYGVDSGSIGCVLVSDIDQDNDENDTDLGVLHDFPVAFEVDGDRGSMVFGHVLIETGDDEDDEYGEEE